MVLTRRNWLRPAWFYGLLVFAFSTSIAEGAGTVAFANGRSIDAAANDPVCVHAVDLDGDGDLDVISALLIPDVVVWYENLDGKGTFSEGVDLSPCCDRDGPRSIATGDVDGDGFPDVVVAFQVSSLVTWFRNTDGLGGFSTGIDIATGVDGASWVELADVDGDGDLDVISSAFDDDQVTWYENTGEGTFATGLDLSTTSNGADGLAVADLDGDGDVDVVVTSFDGDRVVWFENSNGKGAFSLAVDLALDTDGARYLATADLDGDGDTDIVSASLNDGRIVLYENTDGEGTFAAGEDVDVLTSAQTVVAVDLDNDGDIDLVACDKDGGRIVWYENTDGEASFSNATDIALDIGVQQVIAVDLDGDGDLDLLSASRTRDSVVWYENLLVELTPSPVSITAPTANPVTASSLAIDDTATPSPVATGVGVPPTTPDASATSDAGGGGDSTTGTWVGGLLGTVFFGVLIFFGLKYLLKKFEGQGLLRFLFGTEL